MLISVVVPTYNRAEKLVETLEALCCQTYCERELIVVDDGSTDSTESTVAQYPAVQYVWQKNRGPAAARNSGSRLAQGEIIAFTDDDCVPPPTWLEQIARGYIAHPQVAGIGGPCRALEAYLKENPYARYEWVFERAMLPSRAYIEWLTRGKLTWTNPWPGHGNYVGGMDCPSGRSNNISYRRDVFRSLNGFEESFRLAAAEDADFKIRLCLAGHLLLWLDNLIVEHRHPYTPDRFRQQHIIYGRGVVCLERKYRGHPTPRWRAGLRLLKLLVNLPATWLEGAHRDLIVQKTLAEVYNAWGQLTR